LRDSGVLYFVVIIDKETGKRKPYYALLNPFRIQRMLAGMKPGQKETSFPLKALPKDSDKIYEIVNVAYKTRDEPKEQVTFNDDLINSVRGIMITTDGSVDFSRPVTLKTGEQDFSVAFTTEAGVQLPVGGHLEIIPETYVKQPVDLTVSSGDIKFERPIRRKVNESTVELEL